MKQPKTLTDDELAGRIARLSSISRRATAALLAHLIEFEDRGLERAAGFKSLFGYLRHVLNHSEAAAYNRMEAAHAARRFPVILALVAGGELHLSAVRLLAPHLGDENHLALIGGSIRKSRREVEALLAGWFPRPPAVTLVRRMPARRPGPAEASDGDETALLEAAAGKERTGEAAPGAPAPSEEPRGAPATGARGVEAPGATVLSASRDDSGGMGPVGERPPGPSRPSARPATPLAEDDYLVRFNAKRATVAKLRRAQELLSHSVAAGDLDAVFDRALTLLIADLEKRRFSATPRPGTARAVQPESRAVPAAVQRAVWKRDEGRCAFVGAGGRRCEERAFVEFHHVQPWAAGGPPTPGNISLRCRAHNRYESDLFFGPIREAMAGR